MDQWWFLYLIRKFSEYIIDKHCIFEREPLVKLAKDKQLVAFKHDNFWHPMDTLRDKNYLNNLIKKGMRHGFNENKLWTKCL